MILIEQGDRTWQLCLALSDLEALDLLERLKQAGVSFELGENGPIEAEQIHAITDKFIGGQLS